MKKAKEINVVVEFTEGHRERYTRACCERLLAIQKRENLPFPGIGEGKKENSQEAAV